MRQWHGCGGGSARIRWRVRRSVRLDGLLVAHSLVCPVFFAISLSDVGLAAAKPIAGPAVLVPEALVPKEEGIVDVAASSSGEEPLGVVGRREGNAAADLVVLPELVRASDVVVLVAALDPPDDVAEVEARLPAAVAVPAAVPAGVLVKSDAVEASILEAPHLHVTRAALADALDVAGERAVVEVGIALAQHAQMVALLDSLGLLEIVVPLVAPLVVERVRFLLALALADGFANHARGVHDGLRHEIGGVVVARKGGKNAPDLRPRLLEASNH